MKKAVRILVMLLAFALCFSMYGCSKPTDEEVLSAFKELYPEAYAITNYIYGAGLPYSSDEEVNGYAPVSESSPYKTEEEFKAAILAVFTEQYYENTLKYVIFESIAGDEHGTTASAQPRYKVTDGKLYVNTSFEVATIAHLDVESAYISEKGHKDAIVSARRQGLRDKNCDMVLTENGWRFDYRV